MKYQELKEGIGRRLNSAAEDFFTVGYYLRQISEGALFLEDGYESIWDFAKSEFNLSTASASRFMAINSKFSIDGGRTMEPKYIGMGVSKLQEMLTLPDEDLERVTKETTVREIRAMKAAKKKPLSFFGWPETERPEGSLCTTKGCSRDGRGKDGHSCFCCSRPCAIRQEERLCYIAPLGHPFPCSFTEEAGERVRQNSVNAYRCLHLHPEKAPTHAGDGEPEPCCLLCEAYKDFSCGNLCCDIAKKGREKKRREKEKAEEAARRDIYGAEWQALYKWLGADRMERITAEALKAAGGRQEGTVTDLGEPGHFGWASCSPRGIRISSGGTQSKEATWAAAAKALNGVRDSLEAPEPAPQEPPQIIDADAADYMEIGDRPQDTATRPAVPACEPLKAEPEEVPAEEPKAPTEAQEPPQEPLQEPEAPAEAQEPEAPAEAQEPEAPTEAQEPEAPTEAQEPEAPTEVEKPWRRYTASDVRMILQDAKFDLEQYEDVQTESIRTNTPQLPLKMMRKQQIIVDALSALCDRMAAFDEFIREGREEADDE